MKAYCFFLIFSFLFGMCSSDKIELPNHTSQQSIRFVLDTIPPSPVPPSIGCYESVPLLVTSMPRFPGCEDIVNINKRKKCSDGKIINFIQENLKYPLGQCIEGTAVVRFVVGKDGSLSNFEVLRNPWDSAGEEAIRVLKLMPKWIPGKQDGELVRVSFTF